MIEKIGGKQAFMQLEVGAILEGKVTGITKFGAFVELPGGKTGMVHISEVAPTYVKEIRDYVTENQMVKVKVLSINEAGKISLSIKKACPPPQREQRKPRDGASRPQNGGRPRQDRGRPNVWEPKKQPPITELSFEDMMARFKQSSCLLYTSPSPRDA